MKRVFAVTAALALLCLGGIAQAVTIDTVPVGNPGNAADTRYETPGYGSVGYSYNIGKYEVTAAQYTDFLNKVARTDTYGLYDAVMDTAVNSHGCNIKRTGTSGSYTYTIGNGTTDVLLWANRPVNYVSYWDACRFANWLHNGQPTGIQTAATTERGAYTLDNYTGGDGRTIGRNAGWKWAVTSEDEWYKAAYYKGGGTSAGYWNYPTKSNTAPSNVGSDGYTDPGNHANYWNNAYTIGAPYRRTKVGEFEKSGSAYGTFDQGGNVWEWNEAVIATSHRGLRGGWYGEASTLGDGVATLHASYRAGYGPAYGYNVAGFRVSEAVPEPSSIIALGMLLTPLLGIRRRRM